MNGSSEPLACEMFAQHFAITEEGLPHGTSDAGPRSAAPWLSFSPARFSLAGGNAQEVKCNLSFPRGSAGGYYAIIAARGVPPRGRAAQVGEASIHFSYQANVVLMAVAKSSRVRPQFTFRAIELVPDEGGNAAGARQWRVRATVENTGDVHAWTQGQAQIRDRLGGTVWQGELRAGKGLVVPGFPRIFQAAETVFLPDGDYVAGAEVSVTGQRTAVRGGQKFQVSRGQATSVDEGGLVWADSGGLLVSPSAVVISGPPGARRLGVVTVRNALETRTAYTLSATGLRLTSQGGMELCAPDESPRSAVAWIEVSPESFELAAGASTRFRITATIPKGPQGEHYAAVVLTPRSQAEEHALPVLLPVTVTPQGTEKVEVSIADLGISSAPSAGYRLQVNLKNTGNVRIMPSIKFSVLDSKGSRVGDQIPIERSRGALLPGVEETVSSDWPRALAPGKYTLMASVAAGGDQAEVTSSIEFSVPLGGG